MKIDRNWGVTTLGVFALCVQPQACRDEVSSHPLADSDMVETYLQQDVSVAISNQLSIVETEVDILVNSLTLLQSDPEQESLWKEAQLAWYSSVLAWQPLEMMQVASLGSSMSVTGGEDIRDQIYSWTVMNPCRLDQVTAAQEYQNETFVSEALVSVRGLDAIEYLLFGSLETTCPSQVPPVSDGVWASLDDKEIEKRRVEYARVLATEVQTQVRLVKEQWLRGFPMALYDSPVDGLNAVFDAMLYLEEGVKERKLRYPMGLTEDCTSECALFVEGYLAEVSADFILANLEGMNILLEGVEGSETGGLLGVLESINETDLVTELQGIHLEAMKQAGVLVGSGLPMSVMISESSEGLVDLTETISTYTSLLKWDVAAVLELQIPQSSAGDND